MFRNNFNADHAQYFILKFWLNIVFTCCSDVYKTATNKNYKNKFRHIPEVYILDIKGKNLSSARWNCEIIGVTTGVLSFPASTSYDTRYENDRISFKNRLLNK